MSEEQTEVTGEEAPQERDFQAEAKNMGWHDPEGEGFKGDPKTALNAEDFVKRGEEELPLIRANNKKLQAKLTEQSRDIDELKSYYKAQHEREKSDHEVKLREAVSDGDTKRYDELQKNAPKEPEVKKPSAIEAEFMNRNDWYGVDDERTQVAIAADKSLEALQGILTPEKYVDRLEAEIERLLPLPKQQTHNSVASVRKAPIKVAGKTFDGMPQDARTTCKRLEKQHNINREEYVKNYWRLENE